MKTLFIDESGDHNLTKINEEYPVFVLAGSVFDDSYVNRSLEPKTRSVKIDLFGTSEIIFHTSDISGAEKGFENMVKEEFRQRFFAKMNTYIEGLEFKGICCAIKKHDHKRLYGDAAFDPYKYSLRVLVERFCFELDDARTTGRMVIESRGDGPDGQINEAWEEMKWRGTFYVSRDRIANKIDEKLEFRKKSENIAGLQVSDLIANPIGRYVIGKKSTPDLKIVWGKLRADRKGNVMGRGLVILPK